MRNYHQRSTHLQRARQHEQNNGEISPEEIQRNRERAQRGLNKYIAKYKEHMAQQAAISSPDDANEKEADEVARKVSEGDDKTIDISTPPQENNIQRNAEDEEIMPKSEDEEESLMAKSEDGGLHATEELQAKLETNKGGGQAMDDKTKSEMEGKMGADLSDVKIHTGAEAHDMAEGINAKAFTYGQDVYFKNGNYNPSSKQGKNLLAHELTHTQQQKGADVGRMVQRQVSDDYLIKGKYEWSSSYPGIIFFDYSSALVDEEEKRKIPALAALTDKQLTLKGYSSEEGQPAYNRQLISSRLNNVKRELTKDGYKGAIVLEVLPETSEGKINYRKMRSVEVLGDGAKSIHEPCTQKERPCTDDEERIFQQANTEAARIVNKGITALEQDPLPAELAQLFDQIFSNASADDVKENLGKIYTHITTILIKPERHQSGTPCNSTCSVAGAYNVGTGASSMMTMCPGFFTDTRLKQATTLIHESAHAAEDLEADDIAYNAQRLFPMLNWLAALKNADSYSIFLSLVEQPGSVTIGPKDPDEITGMNTGQTETVQIAMARLEILVSDIYTNFSTLYGEIDTYLDKGSFEYPIYMMVLAGAKEVGFDVTDPMADPYNPSAVMATEADKVKVAGISDRLSRMDNVLWGEKVFISKSSTGSTYWEQGPGNKLYIGDDFLALTDTDEQVKLLWKALVKAHEDISTAMREKYFELPFTVQEYMDALTNPDEDEE
jgi:outer membrane protein OmpA-like peptidoglycan-associated protein